MCIGRTGVPRFDRVVDVLEIGKDQGAQNGRGGLLWPHREAAAQIADNPLRRPKAQR
jgi:hypothetical protein